MRHLLPLRNPPAQIWEAGHCLQVWCCLKGKAVSGIINVCFHFLQWAFLSDSMCHIQRWWVMMICSIRNCPVWALTIQLSVSSALWGQSTCLSCLLCVGFKIYLLSNLPWTLSRRENRTGIWGVGNLVIFQVSFPWGHWCFFNCWKFILRKKRLDLLSTPSEIVFYLKLLCLCIHSVCLSP